MIRRSSPFRPSLFAAFICACNSAPSAKAPEPTAEESKADAVFDSTPTADATPKSTREDSQVLYSRVVSSDDRSEADRALDEGRAPIELLSFYGVEPGMTVAELAAGGGYTAELLARVVGPDGKVYGQNTPFILDRFAREPWTERLKKPIMAGVQRIDSELEAPLPGLENQLDAVFLVLFYHDTVWFGTDRPKMNTAVYTALKPGGYYAVIDHSARKGEGIEVAKSLHRIEETTVIDEIVEAGFVLEKSGDFLRNPDDLRDWSASPSQSGEQRGTSDRFVLLFRKPLEPATTDGPGSLSDSQTEGSVTCSDPRSSKCTKEARPVCATVDTKVRCIKAPCPSTEQRVYVNPCMACADPDVVSYSEGTCTQD